MIAVQRNLGLIAVAATALAVTGCSSVGAQMGAGARGPDETAIATRAPLVVPATFDLKAPQPGAPRPQDADSAAAAQRILGGGTVKAAPASEGEQALLAASGAAKADPNVRQELRAEVREASKRKSYADGVLFWRGDKIETGSPLIASEEAERVQAVRQTAPRPAAQPAPVIEKAPEPAPAAEAAADAKEAEQKTEAEDEGGGWFDWF